MLLCFGSPLIDIIATVEDTFLEKYHLTPDSATRSQAFQQPIFQELLSYNHKVVPGGSVTNTARVFQWITKEPNSVFYVGSIGKDQFGQIIKRKLEEAQICHYMLENTDKETGKCAVLITGNEKHRSLVTDLGASKVFDAKALGCSTLQNIIKTSNILYISTFFLGVSTEVAKQVIGTFKGQNDRKKVVVNLGASFLCETYQEEVTFMFLNADLVIGNEKEFLSFAEISRTRRPDESLEENITNLSNFYVNQQGFNNRLLIITRGADPVITFANGKLQYHKVKPVRNIVDTNGAGDAFIGGFLAKYMKNASLEDCIKCGTWCANIILQCIGCDFDNKIVYQ